MDPYSWYGQPHNRSQWSAPPPRDYEGYAHPCDHSSPSPPPPLSSDYQGHAFPYDHPRPPPPPRSREYPGYVAPFSRDYPAYASPYDHPRPQPPPLSQEYPGYVAPFPRDYRPPLSPYEYSRRPPPPTQYQRHTESHPSNSYDRYARDRDQDSPSLTPRDQILSFDQLLLLAFGNLRDFEESERISMDMVSDKYQDYRHLHSQWYYLDGHSRGISELHLREEEFNAFRHHLRVMAEPSDLRPSVMRSDSRRSARRRRLSPPVTTDDFGDDSDGSYDLPWSIDSTPPLPVDD